MTIDEAKRILGNWIERDQKLHNYTPYIYFTPKDDKVILDGDFSADELEAIAVWMRANQ